MAAAASLSSSLGLSQTAAAERFPVRLLLNESFPDEGGGGGPSDNGFNVGDSGGEGAATEGRTKVRRSARTPPSSAVDGSESDSEGGKGSENRKGRRLKVRTSESFWSKLLPATAGAGIEDGRGSVSKGDAHNDNVRSDGVINHAIERAQRMNRLRRSHSGGGGDNDENRVEAVKNYPAKEKPRKQKG